MKSLFLLFITTLLLWTPLSARSSEDSTRLYSAPIWQIWHLVAIAQQVKVQDTLIRYQEEVIRLGLRAQSSSDSVLVLTKTELVAVRKMCDLLKDQVNIQVKLTAVAIKQKRKWVGIAVCGMITTTVAVVVLIVGHR